jgi:phosphoribosylamine---glycine ligase
MNIAVLGSGGREHAIAWKLDQSVLAGTIYVLPGNGGVPNSVPIDITDFEQVKHFCEHRRVELVFVGPEVPLAGGIVNYFADTDIKVFGPSQHAARLESSKIWAKQFMKKHGVATGDFRIIEHPSDAQPYISQLRGNVVIKYDGLAAGKGVHVCSSEAEALDAIEHIMEHYGYEARFLVEQKLVGSEISVIGVTDGKHIELLLPSQDHKPLLDGDRGPNTGGMGAFCPVSFCDDILMVEIMNTIIEPTLQGLQAEYLDYRGVIYFGLMITEDGPRLLEYNVRLGDPEAEVILPALQTDLLGLVLACYDGRLAEIRPEFHEGYFVDVVFVSGGYPQQYGKGYEISGLERLRPETLVFHAGTAVQDGKFVTAGGRVLNIVAHSDDLDDAIDAVYRECPRVHFQDMFYRQDIGRRQLP